MPPVTLPIFTTPLAPVPMFVVADPDVFIFVVPITVSPPELTVNPPAVIVAPPESLSVHLTLL